MIAKGFTVVSWQKEIYRATPGWRRLLASATFGLPEEAVAIMNRKRFSSAAALSLLKLLLIK
jgi:hypothetical protein